MKKIVRMLMLVAMGTVFVASVSGCDYLDDMLDLNCGGPGAPDCK